MIGFGVFTLTFISVVISLINLSQKK
nr:putative holin-like toxin [Mammaliicoccus sp. Marseille-Q6498]